VGGADRQRAACGWIAHVDRWLHARWVALLEAMTEDDFERALFTATGRQKLADDAGARLALAPPHGAHYRVARTAGLVKEWLPRKLLLRNAWLKSLKSIFAEHPAAALLEDGRVLFDMRTARYA